MQLLLASTTDKIQVVTDAASNLDVVASFMDSDKSNPPVVQGDTSIPQGTNITSATTTTVVNSPASGDLRGVKNLYIRNKHTTVSVNVTIQIVIGASTFELWQVNLKPGEGWYFEEGIGPFKIEAAAAAPQGTNFATASTAAGFAADTYLAGTPVPLTGIGPIRIGRRYSWRLIISKTAAGTATPILTIRVGTAGSTADTARVTLTWGAGTAAVDRGEIELEAMFSAIGASAVLRAKANWTTNLSTTGLSSNVHALQANSAAFDATPASQLIGLSYNGGLSAVHTVEWQSAFTDEL